MAVSWLRIRYFLRVTEDNELIQEKIKEFLGIEKFNKIQVSEFEGIHKNKFKMIEICIKRKDLENILKKFLKSLDKYDKKELLEKTELFIREDLGVLYLSVDKQKFLLGELTLSGRDKIQFAFKLITYPGKLEKYCEYVRNLLEE
jgi:RNA binding exosome subunit